MTETGSEGMAVFFTSEFLERSYEFGRVLHERGLTEQLVAEALKHAPDVDLDACKRSCSCGPSPFQWLYEARQKWHAGDLEEAEASYTRVIEESSDILEAYTERGSLLDLLDRHEAAIQDFETVLRVLDEEQEAHELSLKELREEVAKVLPDFDLVSAAYAGLKRLRTDAICGMGHALLGLERYEEALKWYQKAQDVDAADARPYAGQGIALVWLDRHEEALLACNKAREIDSADVNNLYCLACAYWGMDRWDDAQKTIKEALQIDPNYQDAIDMLAWKAEEAGSDDE